MAVALRPCVEESRPRYTAGQRGKAAERAGGEPEGMGMGAHWGERRTHGHRTRRWTRCARRGSNGTAFCSGVARARRVPAEIFFSTYR